MNQKMSSPVSLAMSALLLIGAQTVSAAEENLECKLFVQSTMGDDTGSTLAIEGTGQLGNERLAGVCIFPDGTIADKQFVNISLSAGDGSTGINSGISVYTLESGDALHLRYTGEWGNGGFNGIYEVVGGKGKYDGATGEGSFTGAKSPFAHQGAFDVKMRVVTP